MIISKKSKTNKEKLEDLINHTTPDGECMIWKGCLNTDGYPRMGVAGNSNIKVHRLVAELFYEQEIEGLVVRHTCDKPRCINPYHLKLGSVLDNIQDMIDRNRYRIRYTKDQIEQVTELLNTGLYSQSQISDMVGIDPRRVSDIKTGKLTR